MLKPLVQRFVQLGLDLSTINRYMFHDFQVVDQDRCANFQGQ
ncbi:hypothetical protein ALO99_200179 [Pseudomonas coronafaciens pv. porri]|nr:hypothetical protein ALO99_200179 [Pseudomonas coronafaciens pv. porri]